MLYIFRAQANADAILNDYKKEAEAYKTLMQNNRLNTQGFLAYMGIRAIEDQSKPVYVGMKAPAKTNWLN